MQVKEMHLSVFIYSMIGCNPVVIRLYPALQYKS
ncbi:hypothetical protein EDC52_1196 [Biostraticola tofi]|uniref:Lipoprotein n=1 Tax=Biostraticola tofi TaxID=466109 RepID=A0A4R3YGR4_9GAMM|nr:hypothetical protein EDC52_1196 [Biostraticola tofi]